MMAPVENLTRAEADREVWSFLDRLSRIANSNSFVWEVEEAAIGGAYLAGAVSDGIDIALRLRRKPRFAGELASPLREEFRRRRVWRVLRGSCPLLRLHALDDLGRGNGFRILYRAPRAESRGGGDFAAPMSGQQPERSAAG